MGRRDPAGPRAQLRDACELKSKGELRVGEHAICGRNVTLHCHESLTLGDRVGLAERVTITDSDHANDGSDTWFMDQPVHAEPVVLERNVFCGDQRRGPARDHDPAQCGRRGRSGGRRAANMPAGG